MDYEVEAVGAWQKEIIVLFISLSILFLSFMCFVFHLQSNHQVEVCSQCEVNQVKLPFSIDENLLLKLTSLDIFLIIMVWISGIFSGVFAKSLADKLQLFLNGKK